ncbi:MAG: TolC family protein [Candidatus Omnitrophica bacterium]|nr:TolC family protein [Candidatus Omnitrophota bacterium]
MVRISMLVKSSYVLTTTLSAALAAGCASVPPKGGFAEVQRMVGQRTGLTVHWNQGTPEDQVVNKQIQSLLQEPLTAETAVQIALLDNRTLQATYEELGIAQADLVQAGLLQNPVFLGSWRTSSHTSVLNSEYALAQNFLDIFLLPLRKKLAAAQFEQAKLRVSDAVLGFSVQVRTVYYTLQGAEQVHAMRQTAMQVAEAARELAERQHTAGNINELELATQQGAFQQARLELAQSDVTVQLARERFHQLLGFAEVPITWRVVDQLPALPSVDPALDDLEPLALSQRLDLAAARKSLDILTRARTVARLGIVPAVNVGVDTEHDLDHAWVSGPTVDVEVPIFDQRQAARARANAQLRQAQQQVSALEAEIRSEVRSGITRLKAARQTAELYQHDLIPIRARIVAETQKHVNYMLLGVFQLLQAKRDEVNASREYLEALRDYWISVAELERAVGGKLPAPEERAAPTSSAVEPTEKEVPETSQQHHHGGAAP